MTLTIMIATVTSCALVMLLLLLFLCCVRAKDKSDKVDTTPPESMHKDLRKTEALAIKNGFECSDQYQSDTIQPGLFAPVDSKQINGPTPWSSEINVVRQLEESPEAKQYAAEFLCEGRNIENVLNQRYKDKHLVFFMQHDVPHLTGRLVAYKQAFENKVKRIENNDISTDDEAEEKQTIKFDPEIVSSFKQKLENVENELRSKFVQKNKEITYLIVDEYSEEEDKDLLVADLRCCWENYVFTHREREKWLFRNMVAMQDQHEIPLTESETVSAAEDQFSDEQTAAEWSETIIANQDEQERIERRWRCTSVVAYVMVPVLCIMLVIGLILIGGAVTSVVAVALASLVCCFATHCFMTDRGEKENIVDNEHP